jgi:hypothetical protein
MSCAAASGSGELFPAGITDTRVQRKSKTVKDTKKSLTGVKNGV